MAPHMVCNNLSGPLSYRTSKRRDTSVVRVAQRLLALRNCPPFVPADSIHCAQRGIEVVAACIFHIAQSQKHIVTGCPDPTQVEITFGNGAHLLNVLEIIATFGQNSPHALDAGLYFRIVFNRGGKAMPASVLS